MSVCEILDNMRPSTVSRGEFITIVNALVYYDFDVDLLLVQCAMRAPKPTPEAIAHWIGQSPRDRIDRVDKVLREYRFTSMAEIVHHIVAIDQYNDHKATLGTLLRRLSDKIRRLTWS